MIIIYFLDSSIDNNSDYYSEKQYKLNLRNTLGYKNADLNKVDDLVMVQKVGRYRLM